MIDVRKMMDEYVLGPKVIHRLPGRLRVSVPAIKHIPERLNGVANQLIDKVKYADGMKTVDLNFISGNVLIHYHPNQTDETKVMRWINRLYDLIRDIERQIPLLNEELAKKKKIKFKK